MNRPNVTAATPWHFPDPDIETLANGLTVWQFDLPGQHIATFETVLPAPLTEEPLAKEGVATVALHAIDEGTRSHPEGRIGELLEAQGANLHGSARQHYTTFGGQSPSRRLAAVLPLFTEVLTEPEYAPRDVAHHVEAQLAGFDSQLASPGSAARIAFRRALFGVGHREARPAAGLPETISGLTEQDARAWHGAHFSPDGATLVLAGALARGGLRETLEGWAPGPAPSAAPGPSPQQGPRTVVVHHPGAVQATLMLGQRTPTRSDPRWPALRVAGHAIVGAFASRLNLELRERLGYTYGIGGGFAPSVDEALFTVSGSVRTEIAGDAVARLLEGLALSEPFSATEIDDARSYLTAVAPLANETSADIVAQASALAAAGLDPGYLNRHFAQLAGVTAEQATEALRDCVQPARLTVAVAGDAEALIPALAGVGLSPEVVDLRDWAR